MADPPKFDKKSRYTEGRGIAGAFEGETVTRRRLMEGGAQLAGGVAVAMFALPALGFALGPLFEDTIPTRWQDVGPPDDFNDQTYVPKVINLVPEVGDAGKTTIYVRTFNPKRDKVVKGEDSQPYVAISTRCAHLGCPVRYIQASGKFVCPCHGGVYGFEGQVEGGPPVRPLDRFYTRVESGRVQIGDRFSLNSELKRFAPRDPSNHLDGLWQYLYPSRPTT
ncbi:MAG: menaquinol-cytochrome c reductase iron-sulfur subunit [Thermoleophilaceae bacterium]|nr:menaquinol-cytochrome c reductase iron-sulfur subunit [Thermoleophilaceae bacterium]